MICTIIEVIPFATATGIIIKPEKRLLKLLLLGSILEFKPHKPMKNAIQGVVLHTQADSEHIYLLLFDYYPAQLLPRNNVEFSLNGNAFLGYSFINTAYSKNILLLEAENLHEPMKKLVLSLEAQQNNVKVKSISEPLIFTDMPDLVFVAGQDGEIKKVMMQIPSVFRGPIIFWFR